MAKVVANPDPVPDPEAAKRPGGTGQPKTVTKVQPSSFGSPATETGAGKGRPVNRPRYTKGR